MPHIHFIAHQSGQKLDVMEFIAGTSSDVTWEVVDACGGTGPTTFTYQIGGAKFSTQSEAEQYIENLTELRTKMEMPRKFSGVVVDGKFYLTVDELNEFRRIAEIDPDSPLDWALHETHSTLHYNQRAYQFDNDPDYSIIDQASNYTHCVSCDQLCTHVGAVMKVGSRFVVFCHDCKDNTDVRIIYP